MSAASDWPMDETELTDRRGGRTPCRNVGHRRSEPRQRLGRPTHAWRAVSDSAVRAGRRRPPRCSGRRRSRPGWPRCGRPGAPVDPGFRARCARNGARAPAARRRRSRRRCPAPGCADARGLRCRLSTGVAHVWGCTSSSSHSARASADGSDRRHHRRVRRPLLGGAPLGHVDVRAVRTARRRTGARSRRSRSAGRRRSRSTP